MPLASQLGPLLNGALPREQRFDVIVPMPLHWRKRFGARLQSIGITGEIRLEADRNPLAPGLKRRKRRTPGRTDSRAKADKCRRRI